MANKDFEDLIADIQPSKKTIIGTWIGTITFWLLCWSAMFEVWGRSSDILAIVSGLFAAMWTGTLSEKIRLSSKINGLLEIKNPGLMDQVLRFRKK